VEYVISIWFEQTQAPHESQINFFVGHVHSLTILKYNLGIVKLQDCILRDCILRDCILQYCIFSFANML